MDLLEQAEKIREEAKRQVNAKEITISELARRTAVKQSSMSQFLKRDLNFSLPTLNRLLLAMKMTTEQLQDRPATSPDGPYKLIPVVTQIGAIEQRYVTRGRALEMIRIPLSTTPVQSATGADPRLAGTRFVAIFVTRAQASFMHPVLPRNTLLVIDRHSTEWSSSYRGLENIYAAADGKLLDIGYLQRVDGQLQIHPHQHDPRLPVVTLPARQDPGHRIVGRVCKILL